jgi:GGDEF domain-containing protein
MSTEGSSSLFPGACVVMALSPYSRDRLTAVRNAPVTHSTKPGPLHKSPKAFYHAAEVNGCKRLYCDPLTGLVSYPSFEQHVINYLPEMAADNLHIAIGDVDNLRGYVTSARSSDPALFGHIAGNRCMQLVGATVRTWCADAMAQWPFMICATFGGDEVIVLGSGRAYDEFVAQIKTLAYLIKHRAPCSCSFASATLGSGPTNASDASSVFVKFVSAIDRALFAFKEKHHKGGSHRRFVLDIGIVR